MNKVAGLFGYLFWIAVGFILGVIVTYSFLTKIA